MTTLPTIDATVLTAFGTLALAVTGAAGTYLAKLFRGHLSDSELNRARQIASVAVNAAEQLGIGKLTGKGKSALAAIAVSDLGPAHGINLTAAQWSTFIESEVAQMHQFGDQLTAPVGSPMIVDPTLPTPAQATAAALRAAADQLDGTIEPVVATVP